MHVHEQLLSFQEPVTNTTVFLENLSQAPHHPTKQKTLKDVCAALLSPLVDVSGQGFVTCAFRQAGRQLGKVLWLHGCSPRFIKTTGKLFPVLAIPRVSFPDEFRSNREQYIPLFCACSPQTRFVSTKLTHNSRAIFFLLLPSKTFAMSGELAWQ